MKKGTWILLLVFGILLTDCETNTYSEIKQDTNSNSDNQTGTTTDTGTTKVTYTNDIKTIITNNCLACHNVNGELPTLTTYTQVKNSAINGKLLCTIQGLGCRIMPEGQKMPQEKIDLILLWSNQGYIQ